MLPIDDPFRVRQVQEVSTYLELERPEAVSAFSVHLKDLYYSFPHTSICEAVGEGIDSLGAIRFQNECGISVGRFIDLLSFYLRSTFITFEDSLYIHNKGVCIGSWIAPILSDLVLARRDRSLDAALKDAAVKVFRFNPV